jgi:hypothetical protein
MLFFPSSSVVFFSMDVMLFFSLYFAILPLNYSSHIFFYVGWDSVGCIATGYGLDVPETESRKGRIFCTHPYRPWGPLSLLYNEYRFVSGDKAAGTWR